MEKSNSLFLTIGGNVLLIILTVTALFYNEKSLHSVLDLEKELADISLSFVQSSPYNLLSNRERKIFDMLSHHKTVFTHKRNIFKKLSIKDQRDLDEVAGELGIL